jgi:hypothetical protein
MGVDYTTYMIYGIKYYFGIILTKQILMRNPSYERFDVMIKTECKKLDIKFTDPKFHNVVKRLKMWQ